jgi:threonine aldolase
MLQSGYDFHSDNASGIHPLILGALLRHNSGFAAPYGSDTISASVDEAFSRVFERECFVFSVPTGTAANGLSLGAITPSYGAIFAHENSHIVTTECGAPEFFSTGARIIQVPGQHDKITSETFGKALASFTPGSRHELLPSSISLTQATESGAVYQTGEIAELADRAHAAGMRVHMDGARFTNALVHLGKTPAEMTWKLGVDIVSFGSTKNGTMSAEAVVTFDPDIARTVRFLHKRAGFLSSKMRFQSAQLMAYLANDLWFETAAVANKTAQGLAAELSAVPGVEITSPVEANIIFARITTGLAASLVECGVNLRPWKNGGPDIYRLVTSWNDPEELIARFEKACRAAAGSGRIASFPSH